MGCKASKPSLLPTDRATLSSNYAAADVTSNDKTDSSKALSDAAKPPIPTSVDNSSEDVKSSNDQREHIWSEASASPLKSLTHQLVLGDTQPEKAVAASMLRDVSYSMRSTSGLVVPRPAVDGLNHSPDLLWKRNEVQNMARASRPANILVTDPLQQPLDTKALSPPPRGRGAPISAGYRASQSAAITNYRGSLSNRNRGHGLAQGNRSGDRQQSLSSSPEKCTETYHVAISRETESDSSCSDDSEEDFNEDEEVEDWDLEGCIGVSPPSLKINGSIELKHEKAIQPKFLNSDCPVQMNEKSVAASSAPDNRTFGLPPKPRPASDVFYNSKRIVYDSDSEDSDGDNIEESTDCIHDWLACPEDPPLILSLASSGASPPKFVASMKSARETFQASGMAPASEPHRHSRHLYGLTIVPPRISGSRLLVNCNIPTSPLPPGQPPATCLNVSPPKRGFTLIGTPSPLKQPLYRSGIVNNFVPTVVPLVMVGEHSPSRQAPSPSQSPAAAAIRDTSVVKKKRAELPQHNLPHPIPKFGDWLNSRTMINNYIILEPLGAGGYAEVKLCKEKQSGKLYAMKFINRDVMKKDKLGKQSKLDDIKREIAIMKKLNHPNVLRLYEVMDDPKMNKLFLVLEYMQHGDMLTFQKKKHPQKMLENLRDRDLHCIFLQVILGLAYLHEQKIVHGDIKPQNLLVGDREVVKIADFGISQSLYGSKQKIMDVAGTPAFMSPEMCSGQEYSGQLADVWALGATIFMLKFGTPPFVAKSAMIMFERIQNDPLVFPGAIDPLLAHLLHGMLTKSPLNRLTLLDVMTHPWVTKNENHSLALDAIYHPSRPITVSTDEIEHAVGANHIAIVLNIHKQMYPRLEHARECLAEKKQFDWTIGQSPKAANAKNAARTNRISAASSEAVAVIVERSAARERKVLSSKEIDYRSQLFSRKKASNKNALEPNVSSQAVALSDRVKDRSDDDDVVSDDDELAVSQSPQLLDELLLTTLSMPPLAKAAPPLFGNRNDSDASSSAPIARAPLFNACKHSDDHSFYGKSPALAVSYGVSSLEGRRSSQEDRWVVFPTIATGLSCRDGTIPPWAIDTAYVGLYDGHGGVECATILHEQLHTWIFKTQDVPSLSLKALQDCFESLDGSVCDYLVHKDDLSGSTATALVLRPAANENVRLTIAHVGDCRLVLAKRDGRTVELTQDHRLTVDAERERVLQMGGRIVNNRVNGVMAITRAFGDLEFKGLLNSHQGTNRSFRDPSLELVPSLLTAKPDVIDLELNRRDDAFLLLACDGLWDVLTSDEATAILRERLQLHGDLQLAAHELAQEGIRRYSNDNITVIAITLQP